MLHSVLFMIEGAGDKNDEEFNQVINVWPLVIVLLAAIKYDVTFI